MQPVKLLSNLSSGSARSVRQLRVQCGILSLSKCHFWFSPFIFDSIQRSDTVSLAYPDASSSQPIIRRLALASVDAWADGIHLGEPLLPPVPDALPAR